MDTNDETCSQHTLTSEIREARALNSATSSSRSKKPSTVFRAVKRFDGQAAAQHLTISNESFAMQSSGSIRLVESDDSESLMNDNISE